MTAAGLSAAASSPDVDGEEHALLARAKAGDFSAFEQLVSRHERRVYAIALRLVGPGDAEDVVQTTFLSALEHLDGFREEASFGTWVARIATNAALKALRRRRDKGTVSIDTPAEDGDGPLPHPELIAPWKDDPVKLVERRELRRILDEAIAALPERQREAFVLREIAGLSVEETAQALEITPANVKVRDFRARLMLREMLTRVFGDASKRVVRSHREEESKP